MKKKIACLLPFFLLFGTTTSMTQAQELGVNDLAVHTSDSTNYQSTILDDSAQSEDVVDVLEQTNVANQTSRTEKIVVEDSENELDTPSQSTNESEAIVTSSEEANDNESGVPEEFAPMSNVEEDKQTSEVADETDSLSEAASAIAETEVTPETELAVTEETVTQEAEVVTTKAESERETEETSVQNEDENVDLKVEEITEEKEIKPFLSITLFGITINILGKNKRENSKFKRSLISFDVNKNFKDDWKVLGVSANLPVVGEVGVDLIAGKNLESDENIRTSKGGLLGVKVTNSKLLGNVNLDVASGETSKAESGEVVSSNGGVLGVGINDTKDRGGLNVGLLGGGKEVTGDTKTTHGGLATIDARSGLGNAHVGLIEGQTTQSGDTKISSGGLLLADVEDSIIGDAHIGVAEVNKIKTPDYQDTYFGAINAGISNPIVGDAHVGVGEFRQIETPEYKETQFGLVNADIKNNPIVDDFHLGIGEYHEFEAKDSNQSNNPGNENPSDGNGSDNGGTNDKDSNTGGSNDNESNNGKLPGEGNGHQGNDNSNPIDKPGKPNPKPSIPAKPITPGNEIPGQDDGTVDVPASDDEIANDDNLTDMLNGEDVNDPIYKFIKELTEAGKTTTLNQPTPEELETIRNIMNTAKEKASNAVYVSSVSQLTPSSSSSSTGSSGPSLSGSGAGFAAYFSNSYYHEVTFSNQVNGTLKKLTNQWTKAPPGQPPKNSFFLSA